MDDPSAPEDEPPLPPMEPAQTLPAEELDRTFLEAMSRTAALLDHDGETCGTCHHRRLGADVAQEILKSGDLKGGISRWVAEQERRWRASKYFELWQAERAAGRDPEAAFQARGWDK